MTREGGPDGSEHDRALTPQEELVRDPTDAPVEEQDQVVDHVLNAYNDKRAIAIEYREKILNDSLLHKFSARLSLCETDQEVEKAVKYFTTEADGRYSKQDLLDFVDLYNDYYSLDLI